MDKQLILQALFSHLERELEVLKEAASSAKEGATHEEAKPENQYDTRGLEQSYLAGAQAARVDSLSSAVAWLREYTPPALSDGDPIQLGAYVVVEDGGRERHYFLCAAGAGTKLELENKTLWVMTPGSPLGRKLAGKYVGDVIEHQVKGQTVALEIIAVA